MTIWVVGSVANNLSWRRDYALQAWLVLLFDISRNRLNRNFQTIDLSKIYPIFILWRQDAKDHVATWSNMSEKKKRRRLFWPLKTENVKGRLYLPRDRQSTNITLFLGKICSETSCQEDLQRRGRWFITRESYLLVSTPNTASTTVSWRWLDGCSKLILLTFPSWRLDFKSMWLHLCLQFCDKSRPVK